MKKFFLLASMFLSLNSFARSVAMGIKTVFVAAEGHDDEEEVYRFVKNALFPGGGSALLKFLSENVKYPEEAMELGYSGKVIVQFAVKSDGSVDDVRVVSGIHPLLDEEAVRVVKSMPDWTPAKQRGTPINSLITLPVKFALPK